MKRLRHFFLARRLREKILLLAFIVLGTAAWLSDLGKRTAVRIRETRTVSKELAMQEGWLAKRSEMEAGAKAALESWDPKRTFSAVRLNAELSNIAAKAGIKKDYSIEAVPSPRSGGFGTFHSVRFVARRADFEVLKTFYEELVKRAPYIGLESLTLAADRSNPRQLNANFLVSSVDLPR